MSACNNSRELLWMSNVLN